MEQSSPGVLIYLLLLLYCNTLSFLILGASVKELRYDFTVTEGVDPGKVIGRLELDTDYTYRLNDKNSWFNFDSESGELICISRLDRESLASDRVDLVVLGTPHLPSDPTLFISVRITVADVNDNAPSFPFPFQNVSVPESARLGSQLVLPSATDPDSGENGRIAEYKILSGNEEGVFKLSTTAEDRQQSSGSLLLLVDKELDRERKMLYNLNISATDAGHPQPLSAYLTVFVNVLDANDNAPTFDKSNLHVTVSEKVEKEQHILTVSALDADSGQNAKIYYQLTSDPDQQFEIDSVTGRIKSKDDDSLKHGQFTFDDKMVSKHKYGKPKDTVHGKNTNNDSIVAKGVSYTCMHIREKMKMSPAVAKVKRIMHVKSPSSLKKKDKENADPAFVRKAESFQISPPRKVKKKLLKAQDSK